MHPGNLDQTLGHLSKAHSCLVLFILYIKVENHKKLEWTDRNCGVRIQNYLTARGGGSHAARSVMKTNVNTCTSAEHPVRVQHQSGGSWGSG